MYLDTGNQKWIINVNCIDFGLNEYPVWQGEKTTGLDPTGVYTRTGGCDTKANVTIVSV